MAERPLAVTGLLTGARLTVLGYGAAIALAEVVATWLFAPAGLALHGALLLALLVHATLHGGPARPALVTLALVPLIRVTSLSLVIAELPVIAWYALIGAPVLAGAILAARELRFSLAELGLGRAHWGTQVTIAYTGLAFGLVGYLFLRPAPFSGTLDWIQLSAAVLMLTALVAVPEELIFRALLQRTAIALFGGGGIALSAALYGLLHAGSLSFDFVVFSAAVGLFLGWCADRSGSIWGTTAANGLMVSTMILVWPAVGPAVGI